jgi:hypothetical protein
LVSALQAGLCREGPVIGVARVSLPVIHIARFSTPCRKPGAQVGTRCSAVVDRLGGGVRLLPHSDVVDGLLDDLPRDWRGRLAEASGA